MIRVDMRASVVEFCDNCRRYPEPFLGENGKTCHWFIVDPTQDEILPVDAQGNPFFAVVEDKNPKRQYEKDYWCVECIQAVLGDS